MDRKKQNYFGTKVLILGLGSHPLGSGVAAAQYFSKHGATVLVSDKKTKRQLAPALARLRRRHITYHFGPHRLADIRWADIIVQNPGVHPDSPMMQYARRHHKRIETDLTIFFGAVRPRVVGISGTRGKSTTTALLHHLVAARFPRAVRAGNIGNSPLLNISRIDKKSLIILELSSWMLEGLARVKYSPPVAVLTNIFPDHLDHYRSMAEYRQAKNLLFAFQRTTDTAIYFNDQPAPRSVRTTRQRQFQFSGTGRVKHGVGVVDEAFVSFGTRTRRIAPVKNLRLVGVHNRANAAAAIAAALVLGVRPAEIAKRLKTFRGLPHRLQLVRVINNVSYVNDSHSTTPVAAQAALAAFGPKKIILIAGGVDKKLPLEKYVSMVRQRVRVLILLPGTASKRIAARRARLGKTKVVSAATLAQAVQFASRHALPGETVLLSPAAASFNQFRNAEERGRVFIQAVKQL